MKTIIKSRYFNTDGLHLKINGNSNTGCYLEILESINSQLNALLSHHCKILVVRFDLHIHGYSCRNELISRFFRKLKKKIRAIYNTRRVGHVWVRELEKAKQQHYHCAIFVDGNNARHPKKLLILIEWIWETWDQPKPFTPKNCYYIINRHSTQAYNECFYRLSYLAKSRGKGSRSSTANDYSTSRITSMSKP